MGFVTTPTYRIYSDAALQSTLTISVAESLAQRHSAARKALAGLALPLALIEPASLLGVWAAVRAAMAPIRRFREGIKARGRGDLSPISAEGLPSEFRPNARAVNHLLDRLRRPLQAKRSFTANSAHELRTPVAGALAQVQRLVLETPDEATRARAREVETALQRLARLSEKLMQLARAEGARLQADQPVDLVPVLRMVVADMTRDAAGRIDLALPSAGVPALIDPDALAILARNLIENALRHGTKAPPSRCRCPLRACCAWSTRGPRSRPTDSRGSPAPSSAARPGPRAAGWGWPLPRRSPRAPAGGSACFLRPRGGPTASRQGFRQAPPGCDRITRRSPP